MAVTELISSHALVYLGNQPKNRGGGLRIKTLSLLTRFEGERPFAVQLFGKDPELVAEAARMVEASGADIVDLNFGCPARKVVKGGEGAGVALMRSPVLLQRIATRVQKAVSIPVTAKIRLGWSKQELTAPEIAERLQDVGIEAITIHARYRDQVHSGPVDLEALAETCARVDTPIIGNGGIRSAEDAKTMISRTGCRRVAVGQGAKGNPWIFDSIKSGNPEPALKERIETFKRHVL